MLGFALGKVHMRGPLAERKTIARDAITTLGSKEKPMTTVVEQAKSLAWPAARGRIEVTPVAYGL